MRRVIAVAVIMTCLGFCTGIATLHAAALLNAWRGFGPNFQLGYVVGYIDANKLAQRKDPRAAIPTRSVMDFDMWVRGVNEYFDDPANAQREVPDAMAFVGNRLRKQYLDEWSQKLKARGSVQPSPTPPVTH